MDANVTRKLAAVHFVPSGPVSERAVADYESLVGRALPVDYRNFLRVTGGGSFSRRVVCRVLKKPPVSPSGAPDLSCFLGLSRDADAEDDLRLAFQRAEALEMTAGHIPIADGVAGDFYCIRVRGKSQDIVYWDHDSGRSHLAAVSFCQLVEQLYVVEDVRCGDDDVVGVWLPSE